MSPFRIHNNVNAHSALRIPFKQTINIMTSGLNCNYTIILCNHKLNPPLVLK